MTLKLLKKKILLAKNTLSRKLAFIYAKEINIFLNTQKLRELISMSLALQEMQKGVLQPAMRRHYSVT